MPSKKDDWKLQLFNVKLQVNSTSSGEVLRTPDIKEPAADLTATDKTRKPANYIRSWQSTTGQKDSSSSHNPEQEEEKHEPRLRAVAKEADLESHTASQGNEMKMTHADLDWDKRTMEASAEPEEMMLTQVVFYFCNQRLAGITVKQIKSTSHAQGHQSRHLIPLNLEIELQKFTEADREHDIPLRGELAKKKGSPDKNNLETF